MARLMAREREKGGGKGSELFSRSALIRVMQRRPEMKRGTLRAVAMALLFFGFLAATREARCQGLGARISSYEKQAAKSADPMPVTKSPTLIRPEVAWPTSTTFPQPSWPSGIGGVP